MGVLYSLHLLSTLALWHFFVKVFVGSQFERLPSLRVSILRFSPFTSHSLHSDFKYLHPVNSNSKSRKKKLLTIHTTKMQLDIEMSLPASVWNPNFQDSSLLKPPVLGGLSGIHPLLKQPILIWYIQFTVVISGV